MNESRELTALYGVLEACPDDRVTQLVLGDWYEEQGQVTAAACLRWLLASGKHPYRYHVRNTLRYHHDSWAEGWYWWTTEKELDEEWGYPKTCELPFSLWDRLMHLFDYDPTTFKEYETVRSAYEAAIAAWAATPEVEKPSGRKK
jgi:hypothetical protein